MTTFRASSPAQIAQYLLAHRKTIKITLWLGAGASASSGIPTAQSLADSAVHRFSYLPPPDRDDEITPYADIMRRLAPHSRRVLIADTLDGASQINWTHLLTAQLIQAGWVNLVLTTNFDDLLPKAADLILARRSRIMDLRQTEPISADGLENGTAVYLTGLGDNHRPPTRDEIAPLAPTIRQLLYRAAQDSVVIVLGYSGERDPIFDLLLEMPATGHGFFFVTRDRVPAPHQRALFENGRYAHFFGGYDSDRFMAELALVGMGLPDPPPLSDVERYWVDLRRRIGPRPIPRDGSTGGPGGGSGPVAPPADEGLTPSAPADNGVVDAEPVEPESTTLESADESATGDVIDVEAAEPVEIESEPFVAAVEHTATAETEFISEAADAPEEIYEPADEAPAMAATAESVPLEPGEEIYEPTTNGYDPEDLIARAHEALVMGETAEMMAVAVEALDRNAVEVFEELLGALIEFGQDLYDQDRVSEAKSMFEMAVNLAPNRPEPYWRLHSVARRLGDHEAAERMAAAARERENGNGAH